MNRDRKFLLLITVVLCMSAVGCIRGEKKKSGVEPSEPRVEVAMTPKLSIPTPPSIITDPQQRVDYLVEHYWDNYNFGDSLLLSNRDFTDQAFVDFVVVLRDLPTASAQKGVDALLSRAFDADSVAFVRFVDLFEHYLYDPNSPFANEELYICVLNYVVGSDDIEPIDKLRAQSHLAMALKNRVGTLATNFEYTMNGGVKGDLYDLKANFTIIFFNNPDCHDCARVKEYIAASALFNQLCKGEEIKILSIYPDADLELWRAADYPPIVINSYDAGLTITNKELYDLKAIPTFYLLDRDKRVVLKDAPIEYIEMALRQFYEN